ncbi:ankyrin repeat and sterile alpha motif domain-containing protein 1B-like [Haliotis rubra]|uniref:ankyrin repeat and sterile alpha motif domain-containing protein 1B-like n=1 Tax=Haliotis rubra TaxID=36100 RepID=UPI001EE4F1C0|nr:ankyrin repeat and sterile alpha motif domain-containing protein 1B-like [Haliotis rubra]XP_046551918.1 ankyrin repeat and sterile alpha motif domain-containing protein 1B-like [Haliotis rubra]
MASSNVNPDNSVLHDNMVHLRYLIKTGDVIAVQNFIQTSQIDPCEEYVKQTPPVFTAASHGQLHVMRALIAMGFGFEDPCRFEIGRCVELYSAIHCAAFYGHVDIVRALVTEYNVDAQVYNLQPFEIDECSSFYQYPRVPLWFAIHGGRLNVVQFLIEYLESCHKDLEFPCGFTPLWLAAVEGETDICRYLISRVDNTEEKNSYLYNELLQAIKINVMKAARVLLDCEAELQPQADDTDRWHLVLFEHAALMGRLEMLKLLHSYGFHPEATTCFGEPAQTQAFTATPLQVVRYLTVDLNVKLVLTEHSLSSMPPHIITLLIKAGYRFTFRNYEYLEEMSDVHGMSQPKFMNFVRTISMPKTLQDICCFRVRSFLDKTLPVWIRCFFRRK